MNIKKQNIVGLKELRENMDKYVREINKGKTFMVLRRSQPIFRLSPVDVDEIGWETVVDFTKIDKLGVSSKDVLKAIRSLNG